MRKKTSTRRKQRGGNVDANQSSIPSESDAKETTCGNIHAMYSCSKCGKKFRINNFTCPHDNQILHIKARDESSGNDKGGKCCIAPTDVTKITQEATRAAAQAVLAAQMSQSETKESEEANKDTSSNEEGDSGGKWVKGAAMMSSEPGGGTPANQPIYLQTAPPGPMGFVPYTYNAAPGGLPTPPLQSPQVPQSVMAGPIVPPQGGGKKSYKKRRGKRAKTRRNIRRKTGCCSKK